jgi:DNA-binding Lrp family transcriptional regulator
MAAIAYVLIETAIGKTKDVLTVIRQVEGVKSAELVTGPYDIIAVVEAESLNDIGDLITSKIHAVTGISRTVTCLAVFE